MKSVFVSILVLVFCSMIYAQENPDWAWAIRAGGSGSNYGYDIAVDNSGNSYITGFFKNTASFGTTELVSLGNQDIFVAKYDPLGALVWVSQAGGTGEDIAKAIDLDAAGNIYITGHINGVSSFGSTVLNTSDADAFVAKLDPNGAWQWASKNSGGGHNYSADIVTDSLGNSYITGNYRYTAIFGDASITSDGANDVFVAHLDPSGTWVWASTNQGWSEDMGHGIALCGNFLYVTGHTKGSSFGTQYISGNNAQIFVAKMSLTGSWIWAVGGGGSGSDYGHAITVDNSGQCWVTGYFYGLGSFSGLSAGDAANNYAQVFVGKVSSGGLWTEVYTISQSTRCHGNNLAVDASGNVYVTGYFIGDVSFGDNELINAGGEDVFVAKLNANGTWDWASRAGGTSNFYDKGFGIALDGNGYCYLTGCFTGTASFGSTVLVSPANEDIFVARHGGAVPDPETLDTPVTAIQTAEDEISLSWQAIDGAASYMVYAAGCPDPADWGEPLGQCAGTSFIDDAGMGIRFYRVVASSEEMP